MSLKFKTCQVNGTGWAAVVENSNGQRALLCDYIGSSHVAARIADNERRARHPQDNELAQEVWFCTLPRLTCRISKSKRVRVWATAATTSA